MAVPPDGTAVAALAAEFEALTHAELVTEWAKFEACAGVFTTHSGRIRSELLRRAVEYRATQGVKAAWTVPGMGKLVSVQAHPDKVCVTDEAALGSWVAEHFPSEATGQVDVLPADLERVLQLLDGAGIACKSRAVPRPAFIKNVLLKTRSTGEPENCAVVRIPRPNVLPGDTELGVDVSVHLLAGGAQVDGLGLAPPAPLSISLTLEAGAKARARFEILDAATALAGRVGDGGLALVAAPDKPDAFWEEMRSLLVEAPEPEAEPEDGGAPYDPTCGSPATDGPCGRPESEHGGAKHRGGVPAAGCRRFREAA